MSMKSCPFLYSDLLYENGLAFLEIQYHEKRYLIVNVMFAMLKNTANGF